MPPTRLWRGPTIRGWRCGMRQGSCASTVATGTSRVLLAAGLDPVESLVLNGLFAGNTTFLKATRGWTEQEWAAGEERLVSRGLVADGALTEEGVTFRKGLERDTDRLALEGWAQLGLEGTQRVAELATPLRQRALDSGILPGWTSARRA